MDKEKFIEYLDNQILMTEAVIKNCKAVGVNPIFHENDLGFYQEFRKQILLPEEIFAKILRILNFNDGTLLPVRHLKEMLSSVAKELGIKLEE